MNGTGGTVHCTGIAPCTRRSLHPFIDRSLQRKTIAPFIELSHFANSLEPIEISMEGPMVFQCFHKNQSHGDNLFKTITLGVSDFDEIHGFCQSRNPGPDLGEMCVLQ